MAETSKNKITPHTIPTYALRVISSNTLLIANGIANEPVPAIPFIKLIAN